MAIDTSYSYRDYYSSATASASGTSETTTYNAVFTNETKESVSVDDFLTLMVAQMTNQDFMNPVDDTQFVTQLAQFATMTSMQEMSSYMKTNYVLSLLGQNVTAARFTVSGALETETGTIDKISIVDNEHVIYINGKKFSLEQIMEYNSSSTSSAT